MVEAAVGRTIGQMIPALRYSYPRYNSGIGDANLGLINADLGANLMVVDGGQIGVDLGAANCNQINDLGLVCDRKTTTIFTSFSSCGACDLSVGPNLYHGLSANYIAIGVEHPRNVGAAANYLGRAGLKHPE